MASCLFAKLKECLRNLDVGQHINLVERGEADIQKIVLARNMSKAINDPCSLVVAPVTKRIGGTGRILGIFDERKVGLIDSTEDILSPSNEVTPNTDVIV